MTETISPAETQAAESPRIPRPHTDGAGSATSRTAWTRSSPRPIRNPRPA